MEAEIGIAANKEIAYLAARCGGIRIIDAGRETEFLQWVPLELLELEPEVELQLERLGIRRLGELARLDAKELGSRMGAGAVELVRLVSGQTGGPLAARRPAEIFIEKTELEVCNRAAGAAKLHPAGIAGEAYRPAQAARPYRRQSDAFPGIGGTPPRRTPGKRCRRHQRGPLAVGAADPGFGKVAALARRRGGPISRAGARPASRLKATCFCRLLPPPSACRPPSRGWRRCADPIRWGPCFPPTPIAPRRWNGSISRRRRRPAQAGLEPEAQPAQAVNRIVLRAIPPAAGGRGDVFPWDAGLCAGPADLRPRGFNCGTLAPPGRMVEDGADAGRRRKWRRDPYRDAVCRAGSRTITTRWRWMTAESTASSATCGPIDGSSMESTISRNAQTSPAKKESVEKRPKGREGAASNFAVTSRCYTLL